MLTNGLGGFSSCTMIGSNARNDHALLMASIKAPNHRINMVHRLEEALEFAGENREAGAAPAVQKKFLSSQEYVDAEKNENGYQWLSQFAFEEIPCWTYQVQGVEVVKQLAMKQEENLTAVLYEVENRSGREVTLTVKPHLQFVKKGSLLEEEQEFFLKEGEIQSHGWKLYFQTTGRVEALPSQFHRNLYYAYDACDGRKETGNTCTNHRITQVIPPHGKGSLELVYSMRPITEHAADVLRQAAAHRRMLEEFSGIRSPMGRMLVKSANQFISRRESTGGKTILAGYPFFEDWGRDTMIALAGCCISTGQLGMAKSILRTFAGYCREGLMPNLFPEGENEPQYNTVDASLLFIYAVYLYYRESGDRSFTEEMWPVMKEIIHWYQKGTGFGIHMDEDGLIAAGEGLDQVTWMDVRVGEILPTPRHGKPVEINAYWYNALCMTDAMGEALGRQPEYGALAKKVKRNFNLKFWNEEKGCLRDVVSGTKADDQIRCNQIWAVSMPFSLLNAQREKQVVDTVFEKLYTPYGLRTLDPEDPEFRGTYGGCQLDRDLAYHQGTVWVFPLGAYYRAYLKVNRNTKEACRTVKKQLELMKSALREGCVGQLPEIYDGENPTSSRGCFAQAWSVGEILRVFALLEKNGVEDCF